MRLVALLALALIAVGSTTHQPARPAVRMSVHNRLLFDRAVVSGRPRIEVLILTAPAAIERALAAVARSGGVVGKTHARIGYLRVDVPIEHLIDLVSDPIVEAWHISTDSRKAWYRDGPPVSNAMMFRGFETLAPPRERPARLIDRPALPRERSRESGYTADEDSGLRVWRQLHPTFDGRGVTIAMVESGIPDLTHPAFGNVPTLDGRVLPKVAGIINAMDFDQPDPTRVILDRDVGVGRSWARAGARTYIFPRAGAYRLGIFALSAGGNLVQEFGVMEDASTAEIRIDADGDGDFRNDSPSADVNNRPDVRALVTMPPPAMRLPFVVARGIAPRTIHIYPATGSHITMTSSVAAGSVNADSLAAGVAPNARILIVHAENRLRDYVEGYLAAAEREDVDVINDSTGVTLLPETGSDFVARFLTRIGNVYSKLIVHSANNTQQFLNSASTPGDALSIGGTMGPATFAALFGGTLSELVVHPTGGAGPGLDGSIRPDVLAPVHVIAADLTSNEPGTGLPALSPQWRLPPAYQISCCTSSSSPYAAGLAALLISAAKQARLSYSRADLSRAIRFGARFLEGTPSYKQGNGVFDVNASWNRLNHVSAVPDVEAIAGIVHPLSPYAAGGAVGAGILERDGWRVGMEARRTLQLRRSSGPPGNVTYRVTWTGNDGTFVAPRSITLPLRTTEILPIDVVARSPGAHSALLNLIDPHTGDVVLRTQATIVVAHELHERTHTSNVSGTLATMREESHYFRLPDNVGSMTTTVRVTRGRIKVSFLPSQGVYLNYYPHVHPAISRQFTTGTYVLTLARPAAGVWAISVMNESARREVDGADDTAAYSIEVSVQQAALAVRRVGETTFDVEMTSRLAIVHDPVLSYSLGSITTQRGALLTNGLPNQFPIDVPEDTGVLNVAVRSDDNTGLDVHLYDCSSGECFSHTFTYAAKVSQSIGVRRPAKGRWVAVVHSAPGAGASGSFVIDTVLARLPRRAERATRIDVGSLPDHAPGSERIILFELFDAATERAERDHPWETRPLIEKLGDRPVPVGSVVHRIN